MEFEEDIQVGHVSAADMEEMSQAFMVDRDVNRENDRRDNPGRSLSIGLVASLALHFVLAVSLIRLSLGNSNLIPAPVPETIQIRLLSPPESAIAIVEPEPEVETETIEPEPEAQLEAIAQEPQEELLATEEPLQDSLEEQLTPESLSEALPPAPPAQLDESLALEQQEQSDENQEQEPSDSLAPLLVLPSIISVRATLESMENERLSRFYSYDCNQLEEEEGIRDCAPRDRKDYSVLQQNSTYDLYNPRRERTRSEQTLTTLHVESAALAARLGGVSLPAGLGDYVLEELQAGISTYSEPQAAADTGPMLGKSAASQHMSRIMDPWVRNQLREKEERRSYHLENFRNAEICASQKLYMLRSSELAKCVLDR